MSSWGRRARLFGIVMVTMAIALEVPLSATTATVPEIDGGTLSMGMALLAGGVLVLRAHRRTK